MDLLKKTTERFTSERQNDDMARLAIIEAMTVPAPKPTIEEMLSRYQTYLACGGDKIPYYEAML